MLGYNPTPTPRTGALRLPAHELAQLDLADGTSVYVQPPRRPERDLPLEVIVSPFAPERWIDLWQLDLVLREKPGLLAELMRFLSARQIVPILADTCTFDGGTRHQATVLCDCRGYTGELDMDVGRRAKRERMDLQELRSAITVEFIEDIVFGNGIEPQISLTRNEGHFRAARRQDRRQPPQVVLLKDGTLRMPQTLIRQIEGIIGFPLSSTQYSIVSDRANRMMRVFFIPRGLSFVRVCVALHSPTHASLCATLDRLREGGFDVLGSRLLFSDPNSRMTDRERMDERTLELLMELPRDFLGWDIERLSAVFHGISQEIRRGGANATFDCKWISAHESGT